MFTYRFTRSKGLALFLAIAFVMSFSLAVVAPAMGVEENQPVPHNITFTKVDAITGLPIDGAVFTVDGSTYINQISGSVGNYSFDLHDGNYTLTETTTPPGYQTMTPINFEVNSDGNNLPDTITNDPVKVTVKLTKGARDSNGFPLAGAWFKLVSTASAGPSFGPFESGSDGVVCFYEVPMGVYDFDETQPPPGFASINGDGDLGTLSLFDFTIVDGVIDLGYFSNGPAQDAHTQITKSFVNFPEYDTNTVAVIKITIPEMPYSYGNGRSALGFGGESDYSYYIQLADQEVYDIYNSDLPGSIPPWLNVTAEEIGVYERNAEAGSNVELPLGWDPADYTPKYDASLYDCSGPAEYWNGNVWTLGFTNSWRIPRDENTDEYTDSTNTYTPPTVTEAPPVETAVVPEPEVKPEPKPEVKPIVVEAAPVQEIPVAPPAELPKTGAEAAANLVAIAGLMAGGGLLLKKFKK